MTPEELLKKIDRSRDDMRDGVQTLDDHLSLIADLFDGNLEWALSDTDDLITALAPTPEEP